MIKLSYCTFGLTALPLPEAIAVVHQAGYPGIELSFHRDQFNPFNLDDGDLLKLRQLFDGLPLKPACVATASHFFTPSRPHEPSLMSIDLAGRKRRIDLVKRGIHVARQLGVPLVTFGSGFIREEHVANPAADPDALLTDSIRRCLQEIGSSDNITLLIEPEPGMYIETLDQAIDLVRTIDSPRFKLHLDLCHIYCTERDFAAALARAAPYARYLHVSDARGPSPGSSSQAAAATGGWLHRLSHAGYGSLPLRQRQPSWRRPHVFAGCVGGPHDSRFLILSTRPLASVVVQTHLHASMARTLARGAPTRRRGVGSADGRVGNSRTSHRTRLRL